MTINVNQAREKELVKRFHNLISRKEVSTEVRQSDPDLGISVVKIKQGKAQITIPLVDSNTTLNRNKF